MKKYLMIGFAAVAFAACSNHDFETYTPEQVVKAEYDAKFIAEFGKPGPQQDWGFGATTRAFTRGSNDNKNQWGNPNHGNWQIPPALTAGQVLRVKTYFQQNPNLTFEAPNYSTYFVQQVYKGNTDANLDFSREVYKSANSSTYNVVGSNHMDKLTVGPDNLHVDNFNYGTYNGGDSLNVLNTGATDESNSANYHKDMITLIEDVRPTCVGFNESESSYQHNDHAALVSAATIDAWIEEKFGASFGAKCVDGWDRDFVGLDYEATPADGTYVRDGNNEIVYATIGDYDMGKTYVWDGSHFYLMSEVRNNLLKTPQNVTFPVVSTDKNMYLGDYVKIDQNNLVTEFEAGVMMDDLKVDNIDGDASRTRKHQVLDLTKIFNLVGNGGCAAVNNDKGGFVKNFGGRDYYFSDWIVTLTPAKKQTNKVINYEGRIMAEDLSPQSKSDWDFNDVVFDFGFEGGTAHILLQAAGGTLPLCIGGSAKSDNPNEPVLDEQGNVANGIEVHGKFGVGTGVMVNTGTGTTKTAVPFDLTDKTYTQASQILISVKKKVNGVEKWIVITAVQAEPAGKFVTNTNVNWVDEYATIKGAYPQFRTWVTTGSGKFEPTEKTDIYFNRTTRDEPELAE